MIYTDTGVEFQLPNQDKSYKLFQIKQQIEEAQIAKLDQQYLMLMNGDSVPLNDDKSLADYGITFENHQSGKNYRLPSLFQDIHLHQVLFLTFLYRRIDLEY